MDKANADQDMSLNRRFQTKPVFFEMPTSVQSRKRAMNPLMGVSSGALAEYGIWRHGPSRR